MPDYTQADRPMRIDTVLDEDELLLEAFEGTEGISEPYRYEIDLLSENPSVDPEELLREPVLLTVFTPEGEARKVHGLVSRFGQRGRAEDLTSYRAEVVPWFWFLSLTRNCRVFQNMTVLEIVEEVFASRGMSDFGADFDNRCTQSYPTREYCVQYRESDLNFVSRLLEEEGIFYFFEHDDDKHVLVLADHNSRLEACPEGDVARMASDVVPEEDVVRSLTSEHAVHAGSVTLTDYSYEKPSLDLGVSQPGERFDDLEVYDYHPGVYDDLENGDRYARIRLEAQEVKRRLVRGEGSVRALRAGYTFELRDHYRSDFNRSYLLTGIRHRGSAGDYRSWQSAPLDYENEFLAVPDDLPYRPPRRASKPEVRGTQTAVVVGSRGDEIHSDDQARVKIQFHWDRDGEYDEKSSCWVRVATAWAGKGWGMQHVPRVGQEVLVDFLEGDPDRPIVVGSVYNAEQTPPYDAAGDGKTKSGIRSRSSKGGGGHNEITLDDKKGSELVTIHAQKDMSTTVLNDRDDTTKNNRTVVVEADDSETVGSNQTVDVGADQEVTVGGDRATKVTGDEELSVGVNRKVNVAGSQETNITGERTVTVVSSDELTVSVDRSVNTGTEFQLEAGTEIGLSGGVQISLEAPVIKLAADAMIELKVGPSTVKLTPAGVEVAGPLVRMNS